MYEWGWRTGEALFARVVGWRSAMNFNLREMDRIVRNHRKGQDFNEE